MGSDIAFLPFPWIIVLLLLAFACFRFRKRGLAYLVVLGLFGLYLMVVLNIMFFPLPLPGNWPANLSWDETAAYLSRSVNLIPFYYGSKFIHTSLGLVERALPVRDIAANILLTIPFGAGVKFLAAPSRRQAVWLALAAGFAFEGLQLLLRVTLGVSMRVVDINDVLWNTLGMFLGYGLYEFAAWGFDKLKL